MQDNVIISPPPRPVKPASKFRDLEEAHNFLAKDMTQFFTELYRHMYFIWERTGGLRSNRLPISLLSSQTQTIGNIGNAESDLLQYSLDSNLLTSNDDYVEIDAYGKFAVNGNTKQVKVYFGSSLIFSSNAVAINSGSWSCQIKIVRVSSNSQKIISCMSSDNGTTFNIFTLTSATNDLSVGNNIKFTATGASTNDVTQIGMYVKIFHV
jgi:hypothetical protein